MSHSMTNGKRWLAILLVALAATASGGVAWKVGHDYDERRAADQMRSLGFGVRPTVLWTLDAKRLTENTDDVLLQLPGSVDQAYGYGMILDAASTMVAAVGHPGSGEIASGVPVDDVKLIGIDRASGAPRWRRPLGRVTHCSQQPLLDTIGCWSKNRVVFVDTASGRIRSDTSTDFEVFSADVIDGRAYVSGSRRSGLAQAAVITGGSVDAPASLFRRTYDVRGFDPHVDEILPASNTFSVSERLAGPVQYRTTVFDLDSGAMRFEFDGDVKAVGDGLFRTESYANGAKALVGSDGSTLVSLAAESLNAFIQSVPTSSSFVPVVLGRNAYDPRSGALLWQDMTSETNIFPRAVIAGVVIAASSTDRTLVGVDARTGRRLWNTPWRNAFSVRGGLTDGRDYVFSDFTGMHSIRASDGKVLWTIRLPRGVSSDSVTVSAAGRDILWTDLRGDISVWRARKGPDPE